MQILINISEETYEKVKDIITHADVEQANPVTQAVVNGIAKGKVLSGNMELSHTKCWQCIKDGNAAEKDVAYFPKIGVGICSYHLERYAQECVDTDTKAEVLKKIKEEIERCRDRHDRLGSESERSTWNTYDRCLNIVDKYG